MYQEALLKEIRRKIGDKSLNDEISTVLDISYDAAHRRTSGKAKFSMDESIALAKYYQVSLDQFLGTTSQLVVKKTQNVESAADLNSYFENALQILQKFSGVTDGEVYYSAKDIPFFYTISNNVLSKFKFYVWMNLLNQDKYLKRFAEFDLPYYSPQNEILKEIYERQNIKEVWNESSISSLLMQVKYYFEIGLLTSKDVAEILDELEILLDQIEAKLQHNPKYELYENDLVILNNSILFRSASEMAYFIPFNMFGYMMTNDIITCKETLDYFDNQIKNSKSLASAGNRDRKIFFNKLKNKIADLKNQLK